MVNLAYLLLTTALASMNCAILLNAGYALRDSMETKKAVSEFRTVISGASSIPDPVKIVSAYQWYLLDIMSENLVRFDHATGRYEPGLALQWSVGTDGFIFDIKKDLRFHNGEPLTADDVVASFHRITRLKSSTHYPIWDHLPDCGPNSCNSIRKISPHQVLIDYKRGSESLFMFLTSVEGTIWSHKDVMNSVFQPQRFAGFYFPEKIENDAITLKRNIYSVRSSRFPHAPQSVEVLNQSSASALQLLKDQRIDAVLINQTPFKEFPFPLADFAVHRTIPLNLNYLLRMKKNMSSDAFNRKFLRSVWNSTEVGEGIVPSYGILHPGLEGALSRDEALEAIPEATSGTISVGALSPYYSAQYLKTLSESAKSAGIDLTIQIINNDQFFSALKKPEESSFDFLLSSYVASDKFPFTQLRLVLGPNLENIQIKDESDGPLDEQIHELKALQKTILKRQLIIPLFYAPDAIIAQKHIDLGSQSTTDSDLQLWRINENVKKR